MSRTLTIHTDDYLGKALEDRARSDGKTVSEMAHDILRRALLNRHPQTSLDGQEGQESKSEREPPPLNRREREHAWRRSNRAFLQERYSKEWVVLEGEQVVAHDKDAVVAVKEARTKGVEVPYLFYVQPPRAPGVVRIGL